MAEQTILLNNILIEITSAAVYSQKLEDFLRITKEQLSRIIDTTNFFIALYDEATETFSLPFFHDSKDSFESFPAGKSISAYVIRTGQPLLATRAELLALEKQAEIEFIGTLAQVWLGVPLKVEDKIIGVMVIQNYIDSHAIGKDHLETLHFVSQHIGMSIHRKQHEKEIHLLSELFNQSQDALFITDPITSRILKINAVATELLGYSREELLRMNITDIEATLPNPQLWAEHIREVG